MDLVELPVELTRSIAKHSKQDERRLELTGMGTTTGGMALTRHVHEAVCKALDEALRAPRKGRATIKSTLLARLGQLDRGVLALAALQSLLHAIGDGEKLRATMDAMGAAASRECWAADLYQCSRRTYERVQRAAKERHSAMGRRLVVADEMVAKRIEKNSEKEGTKDFDAGLAGFSTRMWSPKECTIAGEFLWNVVSEALPDTFMVIPAEGRSEAQIAIKPEGWKVINEAIELQRTSNPVFWPSKEPPKPWDASTGGCSRDKRVSAHTTLIRSRHKQTQAAVAHAVRSGTMQPAVDGVNNLQSVAFKINPQIYWVIDQCIQQGIKVPGMVPDHLPMPVRPLDPTEPERILHAVKCSEVRKTNMGYDSDKVLLKTDMTIALEMLRAGIFHTPMNMDWRGRVYSLSHFNFQREDRVRAMFLFANGEPIGEEGLWWLKIHVANCGDFDKISKKPFEERVAWVDQNIEKLAAVAEKPLLHVDYWKEADKPFMFIAGCMELRSAIVEGPAFVTHLPVAYDGSCSGLQHLSAMTRASEGSMVNLTYSTTPQDVYQTVADLVLVQITKDLTCTADDLPEKVPLEKREKMAYDIREMAKLSLAYGVNRSLSKRNVMTYSYSSKKFGMAAQQQEDLMDPLAREVLEGKRTEHPFEGYQHGRYDKNGIKQPSKAANYLAGRIFDAIETVIHKPAEAMKFFQSIAKAMAHEGKPVRWTTPVGIPWINRYNPLDTTRIKLWLNDGGIKSRFDVVVATGSKPEIDKEKAANGIAPNVVHALDASHLLMVTNAAFAEGITTIATVHDSFGCLASQARRFNAIIREQFVALYENHDVLAEILEQANCDLTDANRKRLPTVPEMGPLNLKEILNAQFAFA